jgi:hypothetical protein
LNFLFPGHLCAESGLYLERYLAEYEGGVAPSVVFVYDEQGQQFHSGIASGGYDAGELIPLASGWYWVEVGRSRSEYNLQKLWVEAEEVTVIPSGWVSVSTLSLSDQPPDCDQWNAELNVFRVDSSGGEHLVSSNRGSGVYDFGMIQLPIGDFRVYFNRFPVDIVVLAHQVYRLAVGFQGPVSGQRGMIARYGSEHPTNIMSSLCERGSIHLPSGSYWVSRVLPIEVYPFEERIWDQVVVPDENESGYVDLRAEQVRDQYVGSGSSPTGIASGDVDVLNNYRRGVLVGGDVLNLELELP